MPSTRRKGARDDRRLIHHRERSRVRASLHEIRQLVDVGDADDTPLFYEDKRAVAEMVSDRRSADKVGSLGRWAERRVQNDPVLRQADWDGRRAVFQRMFADDTVGRHALGHIEWVIGTPPSWRHRKIARNSVPSAEAPDPLRVAVLQILEAGAHGDLNRRIRREVPRLVKRKVRTSTGTTFEYHARIVRFLAGRHDVDDFVAAVRGQAESKVVHSVAEEIAVQS